MPGWFKQASASAQRCFYSLDVHQGLVLSPLLFNLYIIDILSVHSRFFQCAHDTVLLCNHSSFESAMASLQPDALPVMDWCSRITSSLSVNKKLNWPVFRTLIKNLTLFPCYFFMCLVAVIADVCLFHFTANVKYLVVTFDHDMTWNSHLSTLSKLCSLLCILYNTHFLLPLPGQKLIINAFVCMELLFSITDFFHLAF